MTPDNINLYDAHPELLKAAVSVKIPVLWGDCDMAQHVNNLIYLRWAETARIVLFDRIMDTSFDKGVGPILGWQDCKYIIPMTYPDTAIVVPAVTEILEDRFLMRTSIYSQAHGRLAAISMQRIVPYDYSSLSKAPIPKTWIAALKSLE